MQQRLELRRHDQVDHEHGQQDRQSHAVERAFHLLALPADRVVEADREPGRVEDGLDVVGDAAQIAADDVRLDQRHTAAVTAANLGRPFRLDHFRHRRKRQWRGAALADVQVAEIADRVAVALVGPHPDLDVPILTHDVRRDVALHLGPDHGAEFGNGVVQRRQPLPVEDDLQFRIAALGR